MDPFAFCYPVNDTDFASPLLSLIKPYLKLILFSAGFRLSSAASNRVMRPAFHKPAQAGPFVHLFNALERPLDTSCG